jgi:hypothetical protein
MDLRALEPFARGQLGLVTLRQLRQHSLLSRAAWYRALASDRLIEVVPGVARLPGAPDTRDLRILARVLAAGDGALASHRSAAALYGVNLRGEGPVDVVVADRRRLVIPGTTVHRPLDVAGLGTVRHVGIPVTDPLRTLVDLGAVAPAAVPDALAHLAVVARLTRRALAATLDRHSQSGRPGVVALRRALAEWPLDRPPDSVLEPAMAALCARYGLPLPAFHAHICGFEVDFAWWTGQLIAECDGWEYHGRDARGFARDRERDPVLIANGWVVVRFSWEQVTRRPAWTAARLRDALAVRGGGITDSGGARR